MKKTNFTKAKLVLVCGLLLLTETVKAQMVDTTVPQFDWAKNWKVASLDAVATDALGNVICAGAFDVPADFDPSEGEYILNPGYAGIIEGGNAFIAKYDPDGNFLWAKKIEPDPNTPAAYDIYSIMGIQSLAVSKRKGDIYLVGTFYGALDLDPGPDVYPVVPENDVAAFGDIWPSTFIVKLNSDGDFVWGHKLDNYNGSNMNITIGTTDDGHDELYFSGIYTQMSDASTDYATTLLIDYDPGPDEYLVGGDSIMYHSDYHYIMKWDENGNFQWFKRALQSVSPGMCCGNISPVALDQDKSIYVTGRFYGIADVDPSEESYIISTVDTLPSESTTSGLSYESYLLKYDSVGNFQWCRYSDAQAMVDAGMYYYPEVKSSSVGVDENNNVYIAPVFRGNMNLDRQLSLGGDATFETYFNPFPQMGEYLPNYYASAIMKYNSNGDFQWAKLLDNSDTGGVDVGKIAVAPNGEIYFRGRYRSSIDFDPGVDTHIVHGGNVGLYNSLPYEFLAKYDSNGNYLWASRINTPIPMSDSSTGEHVSDMTLDNEQNIIYGGMTFDTEGIDVDPTEEEFSITSLDGTGRGYLVKLNIETTYTDTTSNTDTNTAIGNFAAMVNLKVFPNPNQGQLHIKSSKSLTNAGIQIYDISGKTVFERNGLNGMDFMCDLGGLPNGNYILRLTEGNRSASYKLVKQE